MSSSFSQDPQAANATRQRQSALNDKSSSDAPASLSTDPAKKVPRSNPHVKPPFANISMNKFLMNLFLALAAILAFYLWRITIWASDAGGYWALITGNPNTAAVLKDKRDAAVSASVSSSAASSGATVGAKATGAGGVGRQYTNVPLGGKNTPGNSDDIQASILSLSRLLGCSPADLTSAIRPFVDPSVPNPVEEARRIREQVEAAGGFGNLAGGVNGNGNGKVEEQVEEEVIKKKAEEASGPGLLHLMEEAFLD